MQYVAIVMILFSDDHISIAKISNAAEITSLLNLAYRGESSRKGWTTEADLIAGEQRTSLQEVEKLIYQPGSIFLIYCQPDVEGCVNLQQHNDAIYLGMLSVNPQLQSSGIGKKLLSATEEYAIKQNCTSIYMTVIDVRIELINWYKRHGYADTGERKTFEEDGISGKHLQKLQFMVMRKRIKKAVQN